MTNLMELAVSLPDDTKKIGDIIARVMSAASKTGARRDAQADEAARVLFESLTTRLLDWMATGELGRVRELLDVARGIQGDDPLATLAPRERLGLRLAVMETLIETYLRSNNLARHLGVLAGFRKQNWREVLSRACSSAVPLTANDLPYSRSTAHNILTQLTEHGLLERIDHEGSQALYSPTWTGRDVWRAWIESGRNEQPIDPDVPDAAKTHGPPAPASTSERAPAAAARASKSR